MTAPRFFWATFWVLAVAVVGSHILGAGSLRSELWGVNAYAFLPSSVLFGACALIEAAIVVAFLFPKPLDRALLRLPRPAAAMTVGVWIRGVVAVGLSALLFWSFREGHTLLGDGNPLTQDLPRGLRFHPDQPLTYLLHHWGFELGRRLFGSEGGSLVDLARDTVAASSVLAGAAFIPVAWGLARELARALEPQPTDDAPAAPGSLVPLLFGVLVSQGYLQLFFGYVEHYTFHTLFLGAYLYLSLRHLRGAAPLALPGIVLVIDVSLHLSGVLMVPSFLFLLLRALLRPGRRWIVVRDLAAAGVVAAGITALLGSVHPGYNLIAEGGRIVLQAIQGSGHHAGGWAYMFSARHLRDFLNEQALIGPAAAFLLIAGLKWLILARPRLTSTSGFLLAAGVVSLGGAWTTAELGLGYARDWDLFAPSALVFTAAALHVPLSAPWRESRLRRWLFLVLALSLFHTVPWIAVNASFDRSFARFKTLPLGRGRTEAVVGVWYVTHGDTAQAIPWLQRSLAINPANNVAAYYLGRIGMHYGLYEEAIPAFGAAVRVRPDINGYRWALVSALVRGGAPLELARAHLDTLVASSPRNPRYRAARGMVWQGLGRADSAARDFDLARGGAPADSGLITRLRRAQTPEERAQALREDWPALFGP